jgi:hypothetical protein
MTTNSSGSFNRVFKGVRSLLVSGIVEYSFMKCNEYFIKRWELTQRNIAEHGDWRKVGHEHLQVADELTKMQDGEPYGPNRHMFSVRGTSGTSLDEERYGGCSYRVDLDRISLSLPFHTFRCIC